MKSCKNKIKKGKHVLFGCVKTCDDTLSKAVGLMFSRKKDDFCLLFCFDNERNISIHMMFVFYSIDVIFLDRNKKVVEIRQDLKPFSFYTSDRKARYFLEVPFGSVSKKGIVLGDVLRF